MPANKIQLTAQLDDKVSRPLNQIRKQLDKSLGRGSSASFFGNVGAKAVVKGFDLIGSAAGVVTDFYGKSVEAASSLNEQVSKSGIIFGKNAGDISKWAATGASAFGLSKRAALETASGFAGLFSTVGIGLDASTNMAKKLTVLGADLASFFDTDVQTALDALRSGLSGESEPLRRFNVFLSETAVTAKLTQMGITKVGGAFTESQKATARYALILEQTGKAQGNFALTAKDLANAQRTSDGVLENMQATLGQKFLPAQLAVTEAQISFFQGLEKVSAGLDEADKFVFNLQQGIRDLTTLEDDSARRIAAAEQAKADAIVAAGTLTLQSISTVTAAVEKAETTVATAGTNIILTMSKTMTEIAGEIDTGRDAVDTALLALEDEIANGLDPIEEKARLLKISRNIRDEIANGTPAVKAKAMAVQEAVDARLRQLELDSYSHGQGVTNAFAGGLASRYKQVENAARNLAKIVTKYIQVASPAEAGPLSKMGGPEGMGARVAQLFTKGLNANMPDLSLGTARMTGGMRGSTSSLGRSGPIYLVLPNGKVLAEVVAKENYWAAAGG